MSKLLNLARTPDVPRDSALKNIFFGIQGTGIGHISRGRALVPRLRENGADVTCLFSGRAANEFSDMDVFKPYSVGKGLTFATHKGRISYLRSAFNSSALTIIPEIKALDLAPYDVVISDFEPITAHAARLAGKEAIGINNQMSFLFNVPGARKSRMFDLCIKYYAPVTKRLGLHWDSFGQPILPPMIQAFEAAAESDPAKIVVYMDREDQDELAAILSRFENYRFHIYSSSTREAYEKGNLFLKPVSREGFRKDFLSCAGIITNAGFETPSEALHIGKKILVKPLHRHPEQIANAATLKLLGYGDVMNRLDHKVIKKWLEKDSCVRIPWPDVAGEVAQWVVAGAQTSAIPSLVDNLWRDAKPQECAVSGQSVSTDPRKRVFLWEEMCR